MKVKATLQNLKLPSEIGIDWEISPWRTDMLKFSSTATEALLAATEAHLILFVGDFPQLLPFWLLDWLQKWAFDRQVKDAVLAVAPNANGNGLPLPVTHALRHFAKQHGLGFITDAPICHKSLIDSKRTQIQPYRHWGINE